MSWLRKVALLACITGTLSFLWATWNLMQQIQHAPAMPFATIALSVGLAIVAALTPVFYFSLFSNEAPLAFGREQRTTSLIAALVFGILVAMSLPEVLTSFQSGLDPNLPTRLVGEFSNISYLLLLVAIYQAPEIDPATAGVPSGLLEVVSRITVVLSGLGLVYMILQTGAVPYIFWSHREEIRRSGQDPHVFQSMIDGPLTKLLSTACLFAAPYVVALSVRNAAALPLISQLEPPSL